MTRLSLLLSSFFALAALAQEGEAPAGPKLKLAVMPFAALTPEVSSRVSAKAMAMLTTEFKSADAFNLVELKKEKSAGEDDALEAARKAFAEAKELRTKKKFRLAEEALKRCLASYNSAIAALTDMGEIVDAWALLAAVQYNTGRDDEGARSLNRALSVAPERDLPLASTSPLFARVVADARKVLKEGPKGTAVLESTPSNAPVFFDGLALGSTPLSIKEVPPGHHYWRISLPSGDVVGGVLEVSPAKQATAKASLSSKDPESRLLSPLAQNKLDADLLAAARDQAKAADVDLLVFGALSREGKGLALDTFLFSAASGEIRRMSRATFDTELLSAGMEFYGLAGELAKKGDKVGEGVRVPSSVSMTLLSGGQPKLAEAKYGSMPGKEPSLEGVDAASEPPKDEGARKPLEQKRRGPLKRQ